MPKTVPTKNDGAEAVAAEIAATIMDEPTDTTSGFSEIASGFATKATALASSMATSFTDAIPDMIFWAKRIVLEAILPLMVLYGLYRFIKMALEQVMKLYVNGKPNEWVLILNNGTLKQKGIGLSCFRGPFDQVATFPAKVHQVNFTTEQVTNEMQGVSVSGMIVWSINRNGDGPFKAYQNLGEDLSTGNPKTANANLISMSEAIVRTAIAHSTTVQILREREQLRQKIRDEMSEVVKGWGVWLETVEITDVTIKSQPVFKDMQAEYREKIKRVAETYRMKIRSEVDEIKAAKDAEFQEKKMKNDAELRKYQDEKNMEVRKMKMAHDIRMSVELLKVTDMKFDFEEFERKNQHEQEIEESKLYAKQELAEIENCREIEKIAYKVTEEQQKRDKLQHEAGLELAQLADKGELEREKLLAQLKKENLDENMQKLEALQTAETVFSQIYFDKFKIAQATEENDVATSMFNKWFQNKALNEFK